MAEQTVDRIVREQKLTARKCVTATEALLPEAEVRGERDLPPPMDPAAVKHYCAQEWAVHLDDVLLRRTSWHYYQTDMETCFPRRNGWARNWDGRRNSGRRNWRITALPSVW